MRAIHTNFFKCIDEGNSNQHVLNVKVRAVHTNIDWVRIMELRITG